MLTLLRWLRRIFGGQKAANEPIVLVFLNPLAMLLAAAEEKKGSPLTREEVLAVRDGARCIAMPESKAEKFYASMEAQFPNLYPRIDPDRVWEEWQAITGRSEPL